MTFTNYMKKKVNKSSDRQTLDINYMRYVDKTRNITIPRGIL